MSEPEKSTSWFSLTRRKMLGGLLVGAGWLLTGAKMPALGQQMTAKGNVLLDRIPKYPPGLEDAAKFTLMDALYGRRSRRFAVGSEIPDGVLAFKSKKEPHTLDPLEQMLVLTAVAGNTGWHYMIYRDQSYAPHLSSYSAAAGGRTFPSAAGWQVVNFFYTDDQGVYYLPTRDVPSLMERNEAGKWISTRGSRPTAPGSRSCPTGGSISRRKSPTSRGTTHGAPISRGRL